MPSCYPGSLLASETGSLLELLANTSLSLSYSQGTGGVVCVKTKQAVLIGLYDEPIQFGEATKVVEALADYLISVSY